MKNIFGILISFIIAACSFASERITDEVMVLSKTLRIVNKNEKCFLIHNTSETVLVPGPPCFFLRNSENKPQYFSYGDVEIDAVLIITGTPVSDDIRKEWGLSEDAVCGMESQGVLIKTNDVLVTKNVLDGGVLCKDNGSDEKNFWYFAHIR